MAIALPRSRRKSPSRAPHDGGAQNLQHGTLQTGPASRASSVAPTTSRTSDGVALGAQLGRRRLHPAYNPGPYAQRWTRPALAHWVRSATCFPHWCNGRIRAQRFIPHWGNGRSRAQWEKNLTCLAFMSILFKFPALPSTAGTTYHQTLARCDPSTSPAVHTVKNCRRPSVNFTRTPTRYKSTRQVETRVSRNKTVGSHRTRICLGKPPQEQTQPTTLLHRSFNGTSLTLGGERP